MNSNHSAKMPAAQEFNSNDTNLTVVPSIKKTHITKITASTIRSDGSENEAKVLIMQANNVYFTIFTSIKLTFLEKITVNLKLLNKELSVKCEIISSKDYSHCSTGVISNFGGFTPKQICEARLIFENDQEKNQFYNGI